MSKWTPKMVILQLSVSVDEVPVSASGLAGRDCWPEEPSDSPWLAGQRLIIVGERGAMGAQLGDSPLMKIYSGQWPKIPLQSDLNPAAVQWRQAVHRHYQPPKHPRQDSLWLAVGEYRLISWRRYMEPRLVMLRL